MSNKKPNYFFCEFASYESALSCYLNFKEGRKYDRLVMEYNPVSDGWSVECGEKPKPDDPNDL